MPIDITVDGERVTVPLTQPDLDRVCRGKDTFLDGFIPRYVQKVDYLCSLLDGFIPGYVQKVDYLCSLLLTCCNERGPHAPLVLVSVVFAHSYSES